jgi:hypothetical protein
LREIESWLRIIGEQQFRRNLLLNSRDKIRCGLEIDWNNDRAAQETTIKSDNPLGAILTPKQDAIAGANVSRLEFSCELKSTRCEPCKGPSCDPQTAPVHHRDLLASRDAVIKKTEQRLPHRWIH